MPAHFNNKGSKPFFNSISNKYLSLWETATGAAVQGWPSEQHAHTNMQKALQTVPTYSSTLAQLLSSLPRSSLVNVTTKKLAKVL